MSNNNPGALFNNKFLILPLMGFLNLPSLGKVHYHEYGAGTRPLLAFHGYGMTGAQFNVLKNSILPQYRIFSFDHFFHGQSELQGWGEDDILAGMDKDTVSFYLEEWFKVFGRQRISLMAYSIGANFALLLLQEYPDLVDEIILMAPDGLAGYKGFSFLQHNPGGRLLFKAITKSKWLAPATLRLANKLNFVDDSLFTIAYNEIDTAKKRHDVFYTLNLIKYLQPSNQQLAALINKHKIKCTLIFGRDDQLFPKYAFMPFIKLLDAVEVHEVPMGHWLVTPALDNYLVNLRDDTGAKK